MDTLSETPGMESAGPREPYALSATKAKTTGLSYNHRARAASSAQHT